LLGHKRPNYAFHAEHDQKTPDRVRGVLWGGTKTDSRRTMAEAMYYWGNKGVYIANVKKKKMNG